MKRLNIIKIFLILCLVFVTNTFAIHQGQGQVAGLKVVIIQLVTHPSLDLIQEGIVEGLASEGYQEGENLEISTYNAEGDMSLLNTIAKQAVQDEADYIFAITTPVAQALQEVTQDIPIVMAGITDPLASNLVDSLEEPGGNISGISDLVPIEEQFNLIKELAPDVDKIGFIYSTGEDNSEAEVQRAKQAAESLGFTVEIEGISASIDMQKAATKLVANVEAVYIGSDNTVASAFETLLSVAEEAKIPIFSPVEPIIQQGAVAGVAIDQKDIGIKAAEFMAKLEKENLEIGQVPVAYMPSFKRIINEEALDKFISVLPETGKGESGSKFVYIFLNAVGQGILWAVMGLGLFISFRILKFADLTSEASFTMGAATALVLLGQGIHPILAMLMAFIAGSLAGLLTAFLMNTFSIPGLLASIISLTGLYSINLRIMGRPNLSLRGLASVFSSFNFITTNQLTNVFLVGLLVIGLLIYLLNHFFKTDLGQAVIATGDNEIMAKSMGIPVKKMKIVALMLSNGLIALSGSLIGQSNGFADISMGIGTVVIALSSIVIGEIMINKELSLVKRLASILLGSIIYQLILSFVLQLGFNPNDFKLISAAILALFLALPTLTVKSKFFRTREVD